MTSLILGRGLDGGPQFLPVLCWDSPPHSGKLGAAWHKPLGPGGAGKQGWSSRWCLASPPVVRVGVTHHGAQLAAAVTQGSVCAQPSPGDTAAPRSLAGHTRPECQHGPHGGPAGSPSPRPAPAAPQRSSAGLIFNPSCLPHGGWARWPRSPGTCHSHHGGPATPPWSPLGRGVTQGVSLSLVGAQRGSPGRSRRDRRVRGRREAPAFVPGGVRDVPPAPVQTAAALPGNVLAGGTRASKQTDAAPAAGRGAGSRPRSALSPPGTAEQGGRVCTEPRGWRASPSLQEGSTARPPPKPALLGAEEPLESCQGTPGPCGCPSPWYGGGERAQGVCAAGKGGLQPESRLRARQQENHEDTRAAAFPPPGTLAGVGKFFFFFFF